MGASVPPVNVQFQATGVPQVQRAFGQLTQSSGTFSRSFIEANGRVSSFGRQSVQTFNAIGFAASTLTTGGKVGFKELASSAAGFASFFGPAGLIASGVISVGLILTSFWTKQRKEIEDTKKKAEAEFQSLKASMERDADTRARTQDPVRFAREELARLQRRTNENVAKIASLDADPEGRLAVPAATPIARNRIIAARKEAREQLVKEIIEDAKSINEANSKLTEAVQKKAAEVAGRATVATKEHTKATSDGKDAAREAERALEAEIDALVRLGKAGQLSLADLRRLLDLQQQFTTAVRDGTKSLEERAQASQRADSLTDAIVIPKVEVREITETRTERAPAPPKTIELSDADKAKIRGEVQSVLPAAEISEMQEMFAASFASVIAGGIVQGFALGLQQGGIGEGFRQMGAQILTGFGSILTQVGAKALEAALLSNTFFTALMANPVVAIGAAIGLTLLGQALGGRGGGGRGSSGGFSAATNSVPIDIQRLVIDPNFRNPIERRTQTPFTGRPLVVNSPEGQRVLAENSAGFQRRGG